MANVARVFSAFRAGLGVAALNPNVAVGDKPDDRVYWLRTTFHRFVGLLPPSLREPFAEWFLRRPGAPGPAAEHVIQHMHGASRHTNAEAVAKAADNFYRRQYRQYLNPIMGAFAATATLAALSSGGQRRGRLWGRGRPVAIAMAAQTAAAPPILILDHQTAATPLYLPPIDAVEQRALTRWLAGRGAMPSSYRRLVGGDEMRCAARNVRARRQCAAGALIEIADAALRCRKLAMLALHPFDTDAMALHITLFGVEAVDAETLTRDYALAADALDVWRDVAAPTNTALFFLVGGVEEAFTQCSQNLFVKRPQAVDEQQGRHADWKLAWSPAAPLTRLFRGQFEILQATASYTGLPGVSPRNGAAGLTAFAAWRGAARD